MIIYECIKIFDKNMCLCLLLLSNNKYNMPFESIFWHIDWIFFLVFLTKTLMPIQFFFSISWISLILTWDFVFKSSSLAESLSTFLALAGWWSARYKHTIRHQLKHLLSSIFWILIKSFLDGLILLVIWYNCYNLRVCTLKY